MKVVRVISAVALLAIAAFCGFGFLATFEPPGSVGWRIGYSVAGLACLGGLLLAGRAKSADDR